MDIYTRKQMQRVISIPSRHIGNEVVGTLQDTIEAEIGGVCLPEGYVRPKSIRIEKISMGKIQRSGDVVYDVTYAADLLFPREGDAFECKVSGINKMGIVAVLADVMGTSPLKFIVPRDLYVDDPFYQSIKIDDILQLRVVAQDFHYGSPTIIVVSDLIKPEPEPEPGDEPVLEAPAVQVGDIKSITVTPGSGDTSKAAPRRRKIVSQVTTVL